MSLEVAQADHFGNNKKMPNYELVENILPDFCFGRRSEQ